ncbi:hypothetical protein CROQUDRAFT_43461 [Cronartium quercuum f. sp. fusiforme G11]|uniref:EF-hand domain-containing protein n=1 Tax=Cronartium quercuum f. sp. fusiforme G11 TaxID=708437 RepID=A0A9P6NJE7_9BASI|nr:hypothetical protein CROQUDRAFT_43461 [Cronartium quercuum f. sp. fusiforme G11]
MPLSAPSSGYRSPTRAAHISINDQTAQDYVAAVRPSLSRTHTPTVLATHTMSDDPKRASVQDSLNARYERALEERPESSRPTQTTSSGTHGREEASGTSTESDTDDFDWDQSDESELDEKEKETREQEKERVLVNKHDQHIKHAKRLRKVYLALMRLSRPIRTALLFVIGTGIAIIPALVILVRFPHSSALLPVLAWSIWAALCVAGSCVSSIVVDLLPGFVLQLVYLFYGSTPEKLKTQVELWMNVKFWIKLAFSLTWYWVSLHVMFSSVFPFKNDRRLSYFDWITKVTGAFFATGIVLLIEKIVLQIIKLNFHRTSLKDRLAENEKALWALDKLAAAKDISHTPKRRSGFLSGFSTTARRSLEGTGKNTPGKHTARNSLTGGRTPDSLPVGDVPLSPTTPATPSGTRHRPMTKLEKELRRARTGKASKRRSGNLQAVADQLTTAIAHATLKDGGAKKDRLGSSTHSAKKLARKLFEGLDEDRGGVITRNELEPYFKNASDAADAFKLFDKDGNGDIDKKEMRSAVSRIYRERKALATSLKDMSSAVGKLDAVLLGLAFVVVIFIWLLILNPTDTAAQFVPMATIILGFSFIFGNAAKNLFESMLFIFSIHPYDVGDLVFIGKPLNLLTRPHVKFRNHSQFGSSLFRLIDDAPLFVLEFGLFSTTFQRVDGQVMVAPNSILSSQKYILNVRRSGSMWETTNIMVGFDTPLDVLQEFRSRLRQYVNDNPREWKGGLDVNIDYMKNQNLIQLIIAMEHKANWQDWGARWDRRTLLMKEMKKILDALNIIYKLPIQPVSFVSPAAGNGQGRRPMAGGDPGAAEGYSINPAGGSGGFGTTGQRSWNTGALPSSRIPSI